MGLRREIVEVFGKCSRSLNKIALNIRDDFFSQLCAKESDKLLSEFIFFLEKEGERCEEFFDIASPVTHQMSNGARRKIEISQHDNVAKFPQIAQDEVHVAQPEISQQRVVAKSSDIVQRHSGVAQYHWRLITQIKTILKLLEILRHLKLANPLTSLLLERDLLLLESEIFKICRSKAQPAKEAKKLDVPKAKVLKTKKSDASSPISSPNPSSAPSPKLGQGHGKILEFIKSKEGQTQNLEVFSQFNHISRRTLKKKLSDLVRANVIRRITNDRKVFYTPVLSKTN